MRLAAATLVTLLDGTGGAGLVGGGINLFRATEFSLVNIRKEAESLTSTSDAEEG